MNNKRSRLLEREDLDDFDKQFNRARTFGIVYMIVSSVIGIGIIGFVGWAIIKIMQHYGVI